MDSIAIALIERIREEVAKREEILFNKEGKMTVGVRSSVFYEKDFIESCRRIVEEVWKIYEENKSAE